jgi:hypothetical protein
MLPQFAVVQPMPLMPQLTAALLLPVSMRRN